MKKFYISFGQVHAHRYEGVTLDCDCVAEIKAKNEDEVRRFAFDQFNNKYMTVYSQERLELKYFPAGIVNIGSVPQQYTDEVVIKRFLET